MVKMSIEKLIIITGIPRSGTTIIGEVLGQVKGTDYIYEPFNQITGLKEVNEYFEIHSKTKSVDLTTSFTDDLYKLKLKFKKNFYPEDTALKKIIKKLGFTRNNISYLRCKFLTRPEKLIVKDPFLYFLKDYFDENIKIIVTERTTEQIAASFKRMNWSFNVNKINEKLKSTGKNFISDIHTFDSSNSAINGALLDKLAKINRRTSPNIYYVSMNDLIDDFTEGYRKIFSFIGLDFDNEISEYILKRNSEKASVYSNNKAHSRKRNVKSLNSYWKKILNEEEVSVIERIKRL